MALRQSGVELVVKNFSGFIGAMGRVNGVIQKQGEIATKSAQQVTKAGDRVANAQRAQNSSALRLEQAQIRLRQSEERQAAALTRVRTALQGMQVPFEVIVDLVQNYTDAVISNQDAVRIAMNSNESNTLRVTRATEQLALAQQQAGTGAGIGTLGAQGGGMVATIGVIGSKLAAITTTIFAIIGAFTVLSSVVNMVLAPVKALVDLVGKALVGAFNLLKSTVVNVGGALLKVFGAPIVGLFNYLKSKAQEVTSDFMDVLGVFQRFQVMFVALQARDISNEFGLGMAEAFTRAIGPAKGLFEWVKKLAVTTPFTAKGITEVLAMANAMGLNTTQAKELTAAVGNFTAGMGLTEEHMWRIIYNFGQMLAQGKVTGREFRDLAISFVPVWKMLDNMAEKAGMATEEFKKLALEGKVPVPAFFKEFIRMANEDFPGAMERMAKTWEGVIGNAKDFVQVILGVNLFGKVFNQVTAAMANSLQELIRYLSPISKMIGINLSYALDTVIVGFKNATNAMDRFKASLNLPTSAATGGFARTIATISLIIQEVGTQIGKFIDWINTTVTGGLKAVSKNAGAWGYNIVAMIAWGMGQAVSLITQVINYIAGVMAYWLSPGSPPKAFPKLPQWGMAAMAEYLRGFTLADFDALEGIQGPLKDALSILVETGKIGEAAAGRLYKNISVAIAKAISSGVIEESLFEDIARAAGPFGREIAKLARLHIQLAQAVNALKAAEKALEEARKRESQTRTAINKKVREYNAMIRAGADAASLTAKLAEVNAQEDAARLATQERIRQEELVETLEAQVALLQEAVQLQERLVQQLLDITKEQIIKIEVDTSGAESALGDFLENFDWGIPTGRIWPTSGAEVGGHPDFQPENKAFQDWNAALADARKAMEEWKKEMGSLFDPLTGPGGSISKMTKAWQNLTKAMSGGAQDPRRPQKSRLGELIQFLKDLVKVIGEALKLDWDMITTALSGLATVLGAIGTNNSSYVVLRLVAGSVYLVGRAIKEVIDIISSLIGYGILFFGFFQGLIDWFNKARDSAIESADGFKGWNVIIGEAGNLILGLGANIAEFALQAWGKLSEFATNAGETISTWATNTLNSFIEWGLSVVREVGNALVRLWNKMWAEFGNILYWTLYRWRKIKEAIADKIDEAKEAVKTAMDTVQRIINSVTSSAIVTEIGRIITKAEALIKIIETLLRKIGLLKTKAPTDLNTDNTQFGGKLNKKKTTIVGERGWEMLVQGTTGTILNQAQIANVINSAYDAVASYGARPMLYQAVTAAPVRAQPVVASNTLNINFGGVVIANDMDMATFEARVRNVVRQEFS